MKDSYVGSGFFDATASEFIMPTLLNRQNEDSNIYRTMNSINNANDSDHKKSSTAAIGPDWDLKSGFLETIGTSITDINGSLQVCIFI